MKNSCVLKLSPPLLPIYGRVIKSKIFSYKLSWQYENKDAVFWLRFNIYVAGAQGALPGNVLIAPVELWQAAREWLRKTDKTEDSGYIYDRGKRLQIRKPENQGVKWLET